MKTKFFLLLPILTLSFGWKNECRIPSKENAIAKGFLAEKGSMPWLVSLQRSVRYGGQTYWPAECGATLINKQWMVTAAHCFGNGNNDPEMWRAIAGEHDVSKPDCEEQELRVLNIIIHDDYNSVTKANDIALVQVDGNYIVDGMYVKPICLPDEVLEFDPGTECTIAGWGAVKGSWENKDKLLYFNTTVLDWDQCQKDVAAYKTDEGAVLTNDMICTKSEGNRTQNIMVSGVCRGDSGGAMMCKCGEDHYCLAGVVSWSIEFNCGYNHDICTRFEPYKDWVKQVTKILEETDKVPIMKCIDDDPFED